MNLEDYIKQNSPNGTFTPSLLYIPEGDVIHYYFSNEPSYNEYVDKYLTLFKTFEGEKIVGVALHGVNDCIKTKLDKASEALERLHSDCLDNDFNEHWDSYQLAAKTLIEINK